ncbi:adenosine receptor A2b-like [Physella acuta]|uniref:adenosine receptor A2b-like n=1 Tax=Physella acuta TaxID=109671 RepID=UPI0027DD0442|nr:adenosine receptor A2b-like [Physella acuta]
MDYDEIFFSDWLEVAEDIQHKITNATNATHGIHPTNRPRPGRPTPPPPDSVAEAFSTFSTVMYAIFCPIIIVSNILIFWGIVLYPGFYNSNNIFLLSLAVFDFLVGLIATPMTLLSKLSDVNEYMTSTKQLCLLKLASMSFSVGGSLYSLLIISIDRYLAIMFPLKYKKWVTAERAYKVVFFIWFYIFFRAAIPSMGLNKYDHKKPVRTRCSLKEVYNSIYYDYVITWAGRILFGISIFINIHIALIVRKQIKSFKSERSVWTSEQIKSFDARISSVKITLILTALFLFLWAPVYVYVPMKSYDMFSPRVDKIFRTLMGLCLTANSVVNAPIYAAIRNEYRDVYKTMLVTCPWKWRTELRRLHRQRNTSFASSYKSDMSTAKSVESGPEEKVLDIIQEEFEESVVSAAPWDSSVDPVQDSVSVKKDSQVSNVHSESVVEPGRKSLGQQSKAWSDSGSKNTEVSTVLETLDPN